MHLSIISSIFFQSGGGAGHLGHFGRKFLRGPLIPQSLYSLKPSTQDLGVDCLGGLGDFGAGARRGKPGSSCEGAWIRIEV